MSLPEMQCPLCDRIWTPTILDDCLLPGCGCYGTELDRDTPCEKCGIAHAWNCPKLAGNRERVAHTADPKLVELWHDDEGNRIGEVHRGRVSQLPENPR